MCNHACYQVSGSQPTCTRDGRCNGGRAAGGTPSAVQQREGGACKCKGGGRSMQVHHMRAHAKDILHPKHARTHAHTHVRTQARAHACTASQGVACKRPLMAVFSPHVQHPCQCMAIKSQSGLLVIHAKCMAIESQSGLPVIHANAWQSKKEWSNTNAASNNCKN